MATTPNFNWSTPDNTGLVKNGALDIRTLGNSIDASMADLKGGTTGQVLAKATNTDMDFTWVAQDDSNAIQNAIVDAKGDIIAATANDTPARLAVGTNGQVLTADSTAATGIKWATPSAGGGGKVLQVVTATTTTAATNSTTTYADTNLTATITPSATTSKILVIATNYIGKDATPESLKYRLMRDATVASEICNGFLAYSLTSGAYASLFGFPLTVNFLDSPSTTSAVTYKTQFARFNGSGNVYAQGQGERSYITLMEIGA